MLRHRSAIKRAKQDKKKSLRHKKIKSAMHAIIKKAKRSKADDDLRKAYSVIDRAVKKGVLHPNTAARKKSRLAKFILKEVATKVVKKETKKTSEPEPPKEA
ncbi:MAG: 30S ribosomal protein S20 [bacterium]|nr:30S ribosomal protein S20 [bacterium]